MSMRDAVLEAGALGFLRGREQVIEHILSDDEAMDAAARQIDAYIPLTAGAHSVCADAFRDALLAAVAALTAKDEGC